MADLLKTKSIEHGKSTFVLDLLKHRNGKKYVRILQSIEGVKQARILINPEILNDLISQLKLFSEEANSTYIQTQHEEQVSKIVSYYLKGVSAKDLAMQFDCSKEEIEMTLRNKGITVVERKPPHYGRRRKPN